jgi:hypothetical protein
MVKTEAVKQKGKESGKVCAEVGDYKNERFR